MRRAGLGEFGAAGVLIPRTNISDERVPQVRLPPSSLSLCPLPCRFNRPFGYLPARPRTASDGTRRDAEQKARENIGLRGGLSSHRSRDGNGTGPSGENLARFADRNANANMISPCTIVTRNETRTIRRNDAISRVFAV